jgi:NAD+ synthetase
MKIAIAQINPTVGDIAGNVSKIISYGRKAREQNAELVIFSELVVCGYPPMDLLLKDSFVQATLEGVDIIARELSDISVLLGYVDHNRGPGRPLHNACGLLQNGKIAAVQYKTLLPTYDVFDEDRYFEPARDYVIMPIGDKRFGTSICEDIWNDKQICPVPRYREDPLSRLGEQKPDVLINISSSPYSLGKESIRHGLVRNLARRYKTPVFYVNQVGGNDELIFDGRSIVVDENGHLIAAASAFQEDLLIVNLGERQGEVKVSPSQTSENLYEALSLGTRDYLSKCGFRKAVVGLSGGIDSAVVCAVAVKAIGAQNVVGIAMPSPYSSDHSITDARQLAENLGIEFHTIPIKQVMESFNSVMLEPFAGTKADVTEENVQARLRGMILMAMSNKFGYLVLTTGNKSELAVGYCTLYGDMCGGLAVISDVLKTEVYDLAKYINTTAGGDVIPASTIEKPPSAELRPGQKDSDTLPPYPVLDGILRAYIEERMSVQEIVKLGYKEDVVMDVVTRVDRNEYKRYQAAPGLKVTDTAFGFGWRMPIAQRFKERCGSEEAPTRK